MTAPDHAARLRAIAKVIGRAALPHRWATILSEAADELERLDPKRYAVTREELAAATELYEYVNMRGPLAASAQNNALPAEHDGPVNTTNEPTSPRVLCTASVDHIGGGSIPLFEVLVEGGWSTSDSFTSDHRRTYHINATTETRAAQEGIKLFCEDVECLD